AIVARKTCRRDGTGIGSMRRDWVVISCGSSPQMLSQRHLTRSIRDWLRKNIEWPPFYYNFDHRYFQHEAMLDRANLFLKRRKCYRSLEKLSLEQSRSWLGSHLQLPQCQMPEV